MPAPTHGPHCRTVACYQSTCKECRQEVYYWSCNCGSQVLFDRLGEPWPLHVCARMRRLLPLRPSTHPDRNRLPDETNPMLNVPCEFCGDRVRRGRMEEHQRLVHPWRKEVIAGSIDFDDCHDEESLCKKLRQALGARVSIERRADWGLPQVPILRADVHWRDGHQDIYWRAFKRFCQRPSLKYCARLEAYDSSPESARSDAKRLVLFFREDLGRLSMSAKVETQPQAHNEVIDGISLQDLSRVHTLGNVLLLQQSDNTQSRRDPKRRR